MDRRNGGDPQAPPPRPPKSIPSVHRPRAAEPLIMSANLPQLSPKPNHLSLSSSNNNNSATTPTATTTAATSITSRSNSNINNNNNNPISLPPRNTNPVVDIGGSLRHQLPPPLPPAPVSSRSPVVNRSIKPQQSRETSSNAISSPVTFARRRPIVTQTPPVTLITSTVPALSSSTLNSNSTFEPTPSSPVTLAQPRPENERLGNEYVDTPFNRPAITVGGSSSSNSNNLHHRIQLHPPHHSQLNASNIVSSHGGSRALLPHQQSEIAIVSESKLLPPPSPVVGSTATTTIRSVRPSTLPAPITKQPVSFASSKDSSTTALADEVDFVHAVTDSPASIMCPQCKRCRCEQCQLPRQLPSTWLCDKSCLCSAETVIDYASCLCCVKALFYHCSKDHELEHESDTITCADDPCSFGPHRFASRWGWMAALSIVLPCLHCYWPMRGCVAVCAKCYAHHARPGCRCPPNSSSAAGAGTTTQHSNSKTGRSISNILSRNHQSTTNNSHNTASTQLHDLAPEKRLLDSSPDY